MLPVCIFLCLVPNVTHVYLSVSCVQCYPCLSFCVLCPMLPLSIFLCLVPNVAHVYLSVSCTQCYPCLSFCVLFPMLTVSVFLCLVLDIRWTLIYQSLGSDVHLSVGFGEHHFLGVDKSQCPPYEKSLIVYCSKLSTGCNPHVLG
jgi:hypothetical protein